MALAHTIFMGTYRQVLGGGAVVRVVQDSHSSINVTENYSNGGDEYAIKRAFVYNGRVYMPTGMGISSSYGWSTYSPELNMFYPILANYSGYTCQIIPFGDRVGFVGDGWSGYSDAPERWQFNNGSPTPSAFGDYAMLGNNIYGIDFPNAALRAWSYPFTSPPIQISTTVPTRLCELDGVVYALKVVANSTNTLYRIVNNSIIQIGTFTYPNDNAYSQASMSCVALFGYNSKLFVAQGMSNLSTQKVRCYQLNTSTGAIQADLNSYLPAAWTAGSTNATRMFEVRDDAGASEKVYIVRAGPISPGAWEMYEFSDGGAFSLVDSGAEIIWPYCGVVYDESTHGADIKGVSINQSSNYAMLQIATSDLQGNGLVDIDPRYRNVAIPTVDPPYNAMTDKGAGVGSEGKTNLTSKLASPSTLAGLSDDFADGIIDTNLWRIVTPSHYITHRDVGCGFGNDKPAYTIEEVSGELRLGRTADTFATYNGIGLKSKWFIKDDFIIDFVIANPNSLTAVASPGSQYIGAIVKSATNRGYGFRVYRNSSGPTNRARGMYYQYNNSPTQSADSAVVTVADGVVIRIKRDALDVWSIILDPAGLVGGPEILTPAGGANYSEDVQLWIYGMTISSQNWVAASPSPGFKDIAVSPDTGPGVLGRYDDVVNHNFAWDYGFDIGSGITFSAEPYVDTD